MFRILALVCAVALFSTEVRAVILLSTGDPDFNTTEPTGMYAGSGWQFQGKWNGLLATPIAPEYFIAADHIGGDLGASFSFQGESYVTDATFPVEGTDLRIWHVTSQFPSYAPLYPRDDEVGKELVVFGIGTQRGDEVIVAGIIHGWLWGPGDGMWRWGTNTVAAADVLTGFGSLLSATFDLGASPNEAHLSTGDSSGGVFIKDTDGVWKLAGVNFSADGPYYSSAQDGEPFAAALFDQSGFFERTGETYVPVTGPGSFYATRISSNLAEVNAITGMPEPTSAVALVFGVVLISSRRAAVRSPIDRSCLTTTLRFSQQAMSDPTCDLPPPALAQKRLPVLLRRAWYGLNQAFRQRVATLGITPDQFSILRWISEGDPQGLTQRAITDLMASDPNTITSTLARMEKAKLIERRPHESDKRAHRVRLRPQGRRVFEKARKVAIELQQQILAGLPEAERERFLDAMELIADACAAATERACVKTSR